MAGLARAQQRGGLSTAVIAPLHGHVRTTAPELKPVGAAFEVTVGPRVEIARLWKLVGVTGEPRVFFVGSPVYFNRAGVYGEGGVDYPDNARRFALFCTAALEVLPQVVTGPVVLHTHDWHTALAPIYMRNLFAGQQFYDRIGAVVSIHNAGFQGDYAPEDIPDLGLSRELYVPEHLERYGRANVLKGGMTFADEVVTVSPTYANELRTAVGGFGLHDTFLALGERFTGILNGIDLNLWNPEIDAQITARYSASDVTGKSECKKALQAEYGLQVDPRQPLFVMSARLVEQKGLDLILGSEVLAMDDVQFIFLGKGTRRYEVGLAERVAAAPGRMALQLDFETRLEHRLLAGADVLMMPSLYEPCGLTQMRAMIYGTLPIARRVGGLADTIQDGVTGFLFDEYSPSTFESTVRRALKVFSTGDKWRDMVVAAMKRDFGWPASVGRYLDLYRRALDRRADA